MRLKLITIILAGLVGVLILGFLYWYFNHRFVKTTTPITNYQKTMEKAAGDKNVKNAKNTKSKNTNSIPLEKPPFIK